MPRSRKLARSSARGKHAGKYGSWTEDYLRAIKNGMGVCEACKLVDIHRETLSYWRKNNPSFAREEQMIRDRIWVDQLVDDIEAKEDGCFVGRTKSFRKNRNTYKG